MNSDIIEIYTDGACSGNPGPGGLGIVMKYKEQRKELAYGFKLTTNNRMELIAIIVALETLKKENSNVVVYSDSKYVIDSINLGWVYGWAKKGFKDKANPDLWKRFLEIQKKHHIKFVWVKGHASNKENNRCDELAVAASKSKHLLIDEGYELSKKQITYSEVLYPILFRTGGFSFFSSNSSKYLKTISIFLS